MAKVKELRTMTVGELKAYLDDFSDEDLVAFSYPSGDHWRTQLIGTINEPRLANVRYTDYHQCFQVEKEKEDEDTDTEERHDVREIIVLQ